MPASKTIPTETPFYLTATVTDPDGDPLLISWEEVDTDDLVLSCPNGAPNDAATSTTAPLFRSFDPSADGATRYFPQLSDIIDNTQTMGEILPEVGRTINMRCIARGTDANGISGVTFEDVVITVDGNSGPFEVTTASTPTGYAASTSVNVQWLVGNTNTAPISCNNVNILFSSDGGNSFPITLASNVTNNGSHIVTMPANATESGRLKVEAVGNIFFSINKADISIISDCEPSSSDIINDEDVTADAGDTILNLGLIIGNEITSISGSLISSDPTTNLIAEDITTGSCQAFTNMPYYKTIILTASGDDVYNFTTSGSGISEVVNIFQNEFIPPATSCQNWLTSNFKYNSSNGSYSFANPFSISLSDGDVIEMVVSGFSTNSTGSYTVDITSNGSGTLIDDDIIPPGYAYKFVIYNSAGNIMAIEDEADLSDDNTYFGDVYTVVGLVYLSTANLNPYINGTIALLELDVLAGTVCGAFSTNDVTVTVNGCTPSTKFITSTADDGSPGTLRYTVENACTGDLIQFDASLWNSTIILSNEIVIEEDIAVVGFGQYNLTLSGNNSNRIFRISPLANATISNISLNNGYAATNGGAFLNEGNLTLDGVKFEGNKNGAISQAFTNLNNITISNSVNIFE
jgi:hypothetical protein